MIGNKILVVEDEPITAMEIHRLLETSGYQPYSASSSNEALVIAIEKEPDLILMDVKIKGEEDGVKTAQTIKELMEVPVIYITAHSDPHLMESMKLTRPSACLFKPFVGRELLSNIEIALYTFDEGCKGLKNKITH
jgi:two-component system, response regulator PdtaR